MTVILCKCCPALPFFVNEIEESVLATGCISLVNLSNVH